MSSPHLPELRPLPYHHPDAQRLIADVQQEYVRRYGGPDQTPVDTEEFNPPNGTFVLLYADGQPVAMGGWRLAAPYPGFREDSANPRRSKSRDANSDPAHPDPAHRPPKGRIAEIKRMYVIPAGRGRGYARVVLAHLERTAADAGANWLVLETGDMQPEAIGLYESTGYTPVPPFGHYANAEGSIHLGKRLR